MIRTATIHDTIKKKNWKYSKIARSLWTCLPSGDQLAARGSSRSGIKY